MKKFFLCACFLLFAFSAFAQGKVIKSAVRGARNIKLKPVKVARTVGPNTRVMERLVLPDAASYALTRSVMQRMPHVTPKLSPEKISRLNERGILLEAAADGNGHIFSPDGANWYEADEMVTKAAQDGRFIRLAEDKTLCFSLYKDGPEFEFYDKDFFKELDRSRELGIDIVKGEQAGSWFDWVGISPKDIPGVKVFSGQAAVPGSSVPEELEEWSQTIFSGAPAFSLSAETMAEEVSLKGVKTVNDMFSELTKMGKEVESVGGRFRIDVIWHSYTGEIFIRDSRGVLHSPKDVQAVIKAEEARLLPRAPVEFPKIEIPGMGKAEVEFEEIL